MDSYIKSDSATTNYGTNSGLRTDNSPIIRSYLRFDVPAGTILSATLRVYATSANSTGYFVQLTNNGWSELTLNYNNAPTVSGNYGSSGAIIANRWTEVNITSLVTGGAQLNIALSSTSDTATAYGSRESSTKPELVIVYGAASGNMAGTGIIAPIEIVTEVVPTVVPTNTATIVPSYTPSEMPSPTALPSATPSETALPEATELSNP
jgi:acid phosphatase type 7